MSLQFVLGCAGSGKSTTVYDSICSEARSNPKKRYYVIVPEQFTLATQKTLVASSQGKGIMNIDVLSFNRLAYRVFEGHPACQKTIMEDMGKIMVVQKVISENRAKLQYFSKGLNNPGFLDEVKSFLCELILYRMDEEEIQEMIDACDMGSLMERKLMDIQLIYREFCNKCHKDYQMAEEVLPQLTKILPEVEYLRGSVFCFDGFTGFTPVQYELLEGLGKICEKVYVTLTMDANPERKDLFHLSYQTIENLTKRCVQNKIQIEDPIWVGRGKDKESYRFTKDDALNSLERTLFTVSRNVWTKPTDELMLFSAKNPKKEVAYISREVFRLVSEEGYHFGEIAVVCGSLESYQDAFELEFEKMNIRYFIDSKKKIGSNGMAEFILSYLDMIRKDMDYESTIRYMRGCLSGFSQDEVDLFENFILAFGKRGIKQYSSDWIITSDRFWKEKMNVVNEIRARLVDQVAEARKALVQKDGTIEGLTRTIYDVIVKRDVFHRLLDLADHFEGEEKVLLAKEYRNIYPVMMHLFEQMVALLGSEKTDLKGFIDLLSAGISEGLVGFVPPSMDQVVVGDMERSRLNSIKVLFFVGMNDGFIPGGQTTPGILSMREREILQENDFALAPVGREELFTKQFYLYLNMTKPSKRLIMSYSHMDMQGVGLQPAYVIRNIKNLFGNLTVIEDEDIPEWEKSVRGSDHGKEYILEKIGKREDLADDTCFWEIFSHLSKKSPDKVSQWINNAFGESNDSNLARELVSLIYGKELNGTVTRLEEFAGCPFSHFLHFGLKLRPRVKYEIGNPDYGNLFHQALECFARQMNESETDWHHMTEEQMNRLAMESVDFAVNGYRESMLDQNCRTSFVIQRIRRILIRTVTTIGYQMKCGDFNQKGYEINFSRLNNIDETRVNLDDGEMQLRGRIDRVDTYESDDHIFVRVIDYKTGAKSVDLVSIFHGLQMQLAVYLETAMALEQKEHPDKKILPAGMFYYRIKDPTIEFYEESEEKQKEAVLSELKLDGYVPFDDEVISHTDRKFGEISGDNARKEDSLVVPLSTTTKGQLTSTSKDISTRDLLQLLQKNRQNMTNYGNQILHGEKEAKPSLYKGKSPCEYCDYSTVCCFLCKPGEKNYRELDSMKKEELGEALYGKRNLDTGSEASH